jgi:hypothetical protein
MSLIMTNNAEISNKTNALNSVAKPRRIISSGNPGTASHNNGSTDINTAYEADINNRENLIIKMTTGVFNFTGRYFTQLFIKILIPITCNILKPIALFILQA